MPFLAHLSELRTRLIYTAYAIAATTIFCLTFSEELFHFLAAPIQNSFTNVTLIGTGPADAFMIKLKLSMVAGIIMASPACFYQLWRFVEPGLHEHERKFALPFVAVSTLCFLLGISFCYSLVLPVAFDYFSTEYASIGVTPNIRVDEYLSFACEFMLVFGTVFELPVLCYFLARAGLVKKAWLVEKARISIVIIFIVAAILTPPDVVSQMLLATPLLILYALCIAITHWVENRPQSPKK